MDAGRWTCDFGPLDLWTFGRLDVRTLVGDVGDVGRGTVDVWTVDVVGHWTLDVGPQTLDIGRRTLDIGRWTLDATRLVFDVEILDIGR